MLLALIVGRKPNSIWGHFQKWHPAASSGDGFESLLCNAVLNIIVLRSLEKMCRIHAGRIIALVKNGKSFFYLSKMQFPAKAMCQAQSYIVSRGGWAKDAVASFVAVSHPLPAAVRLVDLGPKSLIRGAFRQKLFIAFHRTKWPLGFQFGLSAINLRRAIGARQPNAIRFAHSLYTKPFIREMQAGSVA